MESGDNSANRQSGFFRRNLKKIVLTPFAALGLALGGIAVDAKTGLLSRMAGYSLNNMEFLHSNSNGQFCQYVDDYDRIEAGLDGKKIDRKKERFYHTFPDVTCIKRWPLTKTNEVVIKSFDGKVIARRYATREHVSLGDIPKHVADAFLWREDSGFYDHNGINWIGKFRALGKVLTEEDIGGGSGITEQVAKLAFTSRGSLVDRIGFTGKLRKVLELFYATELDYALGKEKILELYMNNLPLGDGKFGIGAAAKTYFDKDVKDLTEAEALFLAVIAKNPSKNPKNDIGFNFQRRKFRSFLEALVDDGKISRKQAGRYYKNIKISNNEKNGKLFISYNSAIKSIRSELLMYGVDLYDYIKSEKNGYRNPQFENPGFGFIIHTSLDTDLTKKLATSIRKKFRLNRKRANFTATVLDKSGRIVTTLGRIKYRNYGDSHLGIDTWVPTASTIKPFYYGVGYEIGVLKPGDRFYDDKDPFILKRNEENFDIGEVLDPPHNWDDRYGRLISLETALATSNNLVARRVYDLIIKTPHGFETLLSYFGNLGFDTRQYLEAGVNDRNNNVLGSRLSRALDVAAAYGVWINNGIYSKPTIIDRIEFGTRAVKRNPTQRIVFNNPDTIRYVRKSLEKNGRANAGSSVDGILGLKTGTTDETTYAWTAGFLENDIIAYSFAFLALNEHGKSMGRDYYASDIVIPVVVDFARRIAP